MHRYRAAELADDLGISERDVVDVAHDAGVEEFEIDGLEIEYADFDRPTPMFGQRGYSDRHGCQIDVADVELVIDGPAADRFVYLTGADLW